MGRHRKIGLDIAPLDPYLFESAKIRRLVRSGYRDSVQVYIYSLCKISREGYFIEIDEDYIFLVSDYTGIPAEEVKVGLDKCAEVGLFDASLYETGILTSKEIQSQYKRRYRELEHRVANILVYNLIDDVPEDACQSDEILSSDSLEENAQNIAKCRNSSQNRAETRKTSQNVAIRRNSSQFVAKSREISKTDSNQSDTSDQRAEIAQKPIANSSQNQVEEDFLPSFPPHTPPILSIQDRDSDIYNNLDNIERKENKKEKREQNPEDVAEVLPAVPIMTKTPSLEERKKQFGKDLVPYIEKYGKEMIRDFFDYWTEHNEGGKKMRWEIAKTKSGTFSISGRLATWKKKQDEGAFSGKRRKGCLPSELIRELYVPPKDGSALDLSFDVDFDKLLK